MIMTGLLSLAAIIAPIYAPTADVEALLGKLRTAYTTPQTARIEVNVRQEMREGFAEFVVKLDFQRTNKVHLEVYQENRFRFGAVSDGSKIAALGDDRKVIETKDWGVVAMTEVIPANLETICFYDYARQLSTEEGANMHGSKLTITKDEVWNEKTWTILEEVAPDVGVIVKYFIDKQTHLIWRTLVRNMETNKLMQDCQVVRLETGITFDPNRFVIPKS